MDFYRSVIIFLGHGIKFWGHAKFRGAKCSPCPLPVATALCWGRGPWAPAWAGTLLTTVGMLRGRTPTILGAYFTYPRSLIYGPLLCPLYVRGAVKNALHCQHVPADHFSVFHVYQQCADSLRFTHSRQQQSGRPHPHPQPQ